MNTTFMSMPRTRPTTPFNPSLSVPATSPELYLVTAPDTHISQSAWENFQPHQLFPDDSGLSYPQQQQQQQQQNNNGNNKLLRRWIRSYSSSNSSSSNSFRLECSGILLPSSNCPIWEVAPMILGVILAPAGLRLLR
jgi:hypothetical protein